MGIPILAQLFLWDGTTFPDTRIDGSWDGCSGYHYSDDTIYGFSHNTLNGTGVSDFRDIMVMPTMGEVSFDNKVFFDFFTY
jgi:hypothetical protein